MTDDIRELETALGLTSRALTFGAVQITIYEFSLEDLPAVFRLIDQARARGMRLEEFIAGDAPPIKAESFDWLQALFRSGDLGLDLLSIAAHQTSRKWLKTVPLSALPEIFAAMIEVNALFFQKIPTIKEKVERLLPAFGFTPATSEAKDAGEVLAPTAAGAGVV